MLLQRRPQTRYDLLSQIAELENALIRIVAVVATCLNDWISSAARLRLATSCEDASRPVSRNSLRLDRLRLPCASSAAITAILRSSEEATRQAGADRIVDLVRDTGHQPTECGEFFGFYQRVLGLAQILQRRLGGIPGAA